MMRAARLSCVAAALALAGCAATQPFQPTAPTFTRAPVWRVPAGAVEVEEVAGLPAPAPAVVARLAATPAEVAAKWPERRFRTDPGHTGVVVFTVEQADATERMLPRKSGVTALFINDPAAEFTVAYAVAVALFDGSGAKRGGARAEARSSSTLAEGADETARRMLWDRLMHDAAAKLDAELQKQVPAGLPGLVPES